MTIRLGVAIFLACLAAVFLTQNAAAAEVRFLFWSISLSLSLLVFFVVIFGFIIGWFSHSLFSSRRNRDLKDDVSDNL